jgi:signal transduction histidine kinase
MVHIVHDGSSRRSRGGASNARARLARHPAAVDLLIVLALALAIITDVAADHRGGSAIVWLMGAGSLAPLVLRRRAPQAAFASVTAVAMLAVAALAAQTRQLAPALVAVQMLALYTVAAERSRRTALFCAGWFEIWTLIAVVRWAPHGTYVAAVVLMTGTATAALMTGINHQTRRAYLAALEDRAARLESERDQQARLAVAQERTRIAREVHDIVSHSLSVMVALADGAVAVTPTAPERAMGAMEQVAATGRQAIGEMRRMLGTLRTDDSRAERRPQPGLAGLDGLLDEVRAAGLPSRLSVEGKPQQLPDGAQLAVYRIIQESLTNIRRHAQEPTGADVRLRYLQDSIDLEITNDGRCGDRAPAHAGHVGHGIAGMRERAAAYGGVIDAGPTTNGGWRVHTRLNIQDTEPS